MLVLFRLILALALVLAGPGAEAYAMAGQTTMVICSDSGAKTVRLDAKGMPVDQDQPCLTCPDCLSSDVPLAETAPTFLSAPLIRVPALVIPATLPVLRAADHLRPDTRGPPALTPDANGPTDAVRSFRVIAPVPLEFGQVSRGQFVTDRRATD